MHTYLWIVTSWILVAIICYFWLAVYGNYSGSNARRSTITSATRRTGEWFNEVIFWLWRSRRFSPAFAETFTKALNDSFVRIGKTGNYGFEARFEFPLSFSTRATSRSVRSTSRADDRSAAKPADDIKVAPYVEHVTASVDSSEHLKFNARLCVPKLKLKLNVTELVNGKATAHELIFSDVCGEVEARVAQIADELFVMGCFSGRPELHVTATPLDADASAAHSARDLEELARRCFVSAVLNFSVGEILYPDSARNSTRLSGEIRNFSTLNDIYELGENKRNHNVKSSEPASDHKKFTSPNTYESSIRYASPNTIHVRVLGAQNLSPNHDIRHPFVAIEVDEPAQKFFTTQLSDVRNLHNPQWNENFEININTSTKELLFEVYDGDVNQFPNYDSQQYQLSARKFLGLAIVSVSELAEAVAPKSGSEPFIHELALQARPYSTEADNMPPEPNVVGGILLVQCQFVRNSATRPSGLIAPFPTQADDVLRGTLRNFDRGYLYKSATSPTDLPLTEIDSSHSPNADWNNFDATGNKPADIFSNHSLSRSQSSHLNSSILIGRPESALSKNPSGSQVNANAISSPFGRADSRASSSHHSSQLPPIQIQSSQQNLNHSSANQPSPYDRFEVHSQSSGIPDAVEKRMTATQSPSILASPTIVVPKGGHVQFINGKSGKASPKRSSPVQTTSETVVGAEAWAPALHATSMAALSPIRPGIFDFPQNANENLEQRTVSSQPPPVPPHHQSRFDAEFERHAQEQNRTRESSSPQKSRRDESKTRRERSFFDNLRERLTRGTTNKCGSKRARSLDTDNADWEEAAVSAPASRDQSQVRSGTFQYPEVISTSGNIHSTSRISRIDRDSNIQSTLILEVIDGNEQKGDAAKSRNRYQKLGNIGYDDDTNVLLNADCNGESRLRYYLIPLHVATQPAAESLLRAGKKLHVINNHTFVAVKPRGRVPCSVCAKVITSNFTKQAYQCRDCRKVTHKSCHLRGTSPCQESTLSHLPIIDNVNWEDFLRRYQMQEFISVNGV